MKTFKYFLLVAMLPICHPTFAQYDDDGYYHPEYEPHNQTRYTDYHQTYYDDYSESWGDFYLEYSPLQWVSSAKDVKNRTFHTATIGYGYDFQLGEVPVYIEASFEASGAWHSQRYNDGTKYSMNLYFAKIPINLAYRWTLNDNFAIVPFGGAYVKWNIYGEEREKDSYGNTYKWELFDKNYTNDDDYNRFQLGYQAGLKLIIGNCLSIGASWKADITSFCTYYDDWTNKEEKERFQGIAVHIGYCF